MSEQNRNGKEAPNRTPAVTNGFKISISSRFTTVAYAHKRASAVSAAEPIAKPFPIAAVVFPTESSLSVLSLTYFSRFAICAMPPALSDIGP